MASVLRFEHSLELPVVHRVQKALRAFFRSFEAGVWTLDATQRGDGAALHLTRGNWKTSSLTGVGGVYREPGEPSWVFQQGYLPRTIPMLLSVVVNESTAGVSIRLSHSAFSRFADSDLREICHKAVDDELKALAKYLKQAYHLSRVPDVVVLQPADDPSCAV